ncbi:mitogen-activated protein kinase kinase kinase 7 [Clonorchis sinensis]|uniref:Mitogen-activated protein kinase kinase kinase 7 n=1 Tax=Clonorchis sinensis TaxID=79923 RepID=G7YAE1_CLOSI|nr:mitogen-activated protein kinase kinase kinase 7 [Clonorchis sinensis]
MDVLVEGVKLSDVHVQNIDTSEYQQLINSAVLCGTGRFGLIYRTDWRDRTVAIKTFTGPSSDVGRQRSELLFHAIASHLNIVRILAAGPDFPKRCQFYVMEYATGSSLNEVLYQFPDVSYTLAHAISWTSQVAQGADYLHRICTPRLCHGDLKPANMLVFDQGRLVKLTDFGSAGPLSQTTEQTPRPLTPVYTAPEIAYLKAGMPLVYTEKCDVYSLAISFWEFLARRRPFEDQSRPTFWNLFNRRPSAIRGCPEDLWSICESGWADDPTSRPTMIQIVEFLEFALQKILLGTTGRLNPLSLPALLPPCTNDSPQDAWPPEHDPSNLPPTSPHDSAEVCGHVEESERKDTSSDISADTQPQRELDPLTVSCDFETE